MLWDIWICLRILENPIFETFGIFGIYYKVWISWKFWIYQLPNLYPENLKFPQLPGQYPETFFYIEHCTVLYSARYQYPYGYKDFFKLGAIWRFDEGKLTALRNIWRSMIRLSDCLSDTSLSGLWLDKTKFICVLIGLKARNGWWGI